MTPAPDRVRDALARRVGIDARALAAFRVALGAIVLADLLVRSLDLVAFYTDRGVLPRSALAEQYPLAARLSLHAVSGAAPAQAVLFLLAAVAAAALLVGYRTRVATLVSALLLASLQARNPLVLNSGDLVLLMLLSLGVLLPLGERWSLDALGRGRRGGDGRVATLATALILLEVVAVFATNAVYKLRGGHWNGGEALQRAVRLDQYTILLGDHLAAVPELVAVLGRAWLALLVASPLLIVLVGRPRAVLAALYLGAFAGMALTMSVGVFPFVLTAGLLLFLPPAVWDAAERTVASRVDAAVRKRWRDRLPTPRPRRRSLPPALAAWRRRVGPVFVGALLVTCLAWNVGSVGYAEPFSPVDGVEAEDFQWRMFADPPSGYEWYVVTADLEDGRQVDALDRSIDDWTDPPDAADTYPTVRWRTYAKHVRVADNDDRLAAYACGRASARHGAVVERVTITEYERLVDADGTSPTIETELVAREC